MKLRNYPLAISAVAIVALSACANPARFDDGTSKTANRDGGVILGTLVGGILGSAVSGDGDKRKGAIIGATLGAGAGALIGNNLDQQEADLRRDIGNSQAQITNTGDSIVVTMPQDILFATNSASLRSDLRRDLNAIAGNLLAYPNSTIQIVGHTDNTGSAAFNQDLSEQRALAVANVLINGGVPGQRIDAVGMGESQPKASNLTPEGRAQNRRVDIIIRPTR